MPLRSVTAGNLRLLRARRVAGPLSAAVRSNVHEVARAAYIPVCGWLSSRAGRRGRALCGLSQRAHPPGKRWDGDLRGGPPEAEEPFDGFEDQIGLGLPLLARGLGELALKLIGQVNRHSGHDTMV
jgi:hypothetical protein